MKITTEIPEQILLDAEKTFGLKGKSLSYVGVLCALILHKSNTNTVYFNQQIPLSKKFLQKCLSDYFLRKLRKDLRHIRVGNESHNKLFEVNDTFTKTTKHKRGVSKKYSITQRYLLSSNWTVFTFDIPDDLSDNELFPDALAHFYSSASQITLDNRVFNSYESLFSYELINGNSSNGISRFRIARTTDEKNILAKSNWTEGHYSKLLSLSDQVQEEILTEPRHLNWWRKKYKATLADSNLILIEEEGYLVVSDQDSYLNLKRERSINILKKKLDSIKQGEFHISISKSNGRLSSNFTSLNSPLFRFVKLEGHHLVSYDLKASQPTILLNLILGNKLLLQSISCSIYPQLKKFSNKLKKLTSNDFSLNAMLKYVQEEDIYSLIAEGKEISRGEAKVIVLKWLFGKGTIKFDHMGAINERFPLFKEHLVKAKGLFNTKEQENGLAILLQRVESHIFIEQILGELAKKGIPAITKHDSVLVADTDERRKQVTEVIDKVFERTGFNGKIAIPEALYLWEDDDSRFEQYDRFQYYAYPEFFHNLDKTIEAGLRGEMPTWIDN